MSSVQFCVHEAGRKTMASYGLLYDQNYDSKGNRIDEIEKERQLKRDSER